ncbi:hypothetical protein ACFWJY_00240 [Streptomyces anulatus]|uniref:hypothetical protein n=1 Tax=Streptomyces anulatus TaxID=1892 RepID=UPI00365686F3
MTDSVVGAGGVDVVFLMRARARLSALAVQLEVAPFAEQTVTAMQAYLDHDAESALAHFGRWVALPKQARDELAARLREVEA